MRIFSKEKPQPPSDNPPPSVAKGESYVATRPEGFLEHFDEEGRLSIQRANYDSEFQHTDSGFWLRELGGECVEPKLVPAAKSFALIKKHLRDLVGQVEDELPWYEVEETWAKVKELCDKARAMGYKEGAEFLEVVCSRFVKKHNLGLRTKYTPSYDDIVYSGDEDVTRDIKA